MTAEPLRQRSLNLRVRDRPGRDEVQARPKQSLIRGADRVAEERHDVEDIAQGDHREGVTVLRRPVVDLRLRGRTALRPAVVGRVDDEAVVFVLLVGCLQTGGMRGAKASCEVA